MINRSRAGDVQLFLRENPRHLWVMLALWLAVGIFFLFVLTFWPSLSIGERFQIVLLPVTIAIAYAVYLLQDFNEYRTRRSTKESAIRSLLTELDNDAQYLMSIRHHYLSGNARRGGIFARFLDSIQNDKSIPDSEKERIRDCFQLVELDEISDSDANSVEQAIAQFEQLYAWNSDAEDRAMKVSYIQKHLPILRLTFSYETRLTYGTLQNMQIRTVTDGALVHALAEYTKYANIMEYCFNILAQWRQTGEPQPDSSWYLNAALTRVQYSKKTLRCIQDILCCIANDEEVSITLSGGKNGQYPHLYKLWHGDV